MRFQQVLLLLWISGVSPEDRVPDGAPKKKDARHALDLIERLLNATDNRVRPYIYGPPVDVKCDFYVQDFGPLDDTNMDFHMDIFFRQRYIDSRLTFASQKDPIAIPSAYTHHLWMPDLFFPNEKEAEVHQVTTPNAVIKIFPDGTVRYSARIKVRLACAMDLTHFPHDNQKCSLKVSSYSYDKDSVMLSWLNDHPVEMYEEKLQLPQFSMLSVEAGECKESLTTGKFGCLIATFRLRREVGYFILQAYLPSILIVVLSWVSFWISKDAVPARITLGVTTVLTMTTQLASSRSQTMRVSYPKALDVWYAVCMAFVFGALLEYALVNVMWRTAPKRRAKRIEKRRRSTIKIRDIEKGRNGGRSCQTKRDEDSPFNDSCSDGEEVQEVTWLEGRIPCTNKTFTAGSVDGVSRLVFPLSFVAFNVIYWFFYCFPEEGF